MKSVILRINLGCVQKYLNWFEHKKHFIEKKHRQREMLYISRFANEYIKLKVRKTAEGYSFQWFLYVQLGERFNTEKK